tara:strand:- start:1619 stop:1852 length:234 start_codon:yes stop_codon:yes gene_type:complete
MDKIPVKDHAGWFRDEGGGIECADTSTYERYMKGYKAEQKQKKEFVALQNDVSGLKSDIGEIKSLLLTLAEKNHGRT